MSLYLGSNLVSANGVLIGAGAVDLFYPVGSIYLSVNSTNPGSIFGGTWVAFGAGRVLVGVDANELDVVLYDEPATLNNLQPDITCYMWRRTA